MPDAGEIRKKTRRIALCGLLGALGAVCMLLGGMIPFATFCCPVLASLALLPAMDECGGAWALGLYAVLSALSLLLAPDRESAALFVFLGYYPLLQRILCRCAAPRCGCSASWRFLIWRQRRLLGSWPMSWEYRDRRQSVLHSRAG